MSDADSKVDQVRSLMDRAVHASTGTEEARTSALIAVKMAKDLGLRFATDKEMTELAELRELAKRFKEAQAQAQVQSRRAYPWPFNQYAPPSRGYTPPAAAASGEASAAPPFDPFAGFRKKQRKRTERSEQVRDVPQGFAVIVSAYRGHCRSCRREYKEGAEIAWRRGVGATHYKCRAYWDELDATAAG